MEKKLITTYAGMDSTTTIDGNEFNLLDEEIQFQDLETLEEELSDLFDTHKVEKNLEKYGFDIPKLYVERNTAPMKPEDDEFHLPLQNRDIYDEKSYTEFQKILARLQSGNDTTPVIRFKIDYNVIWEGIS